MTTATTATTAATGRPVPAVIGRGQLFIDGTWRDAADGRVTATINPTTEEAITEVARGGAVDADAAALAARRAFDEGPWARMRGSERARILHRIGDLIMENAHELAYREAVDMGKLYTDAMTVDVPHIANMFHYYAGWATKLSGEALPVERLPSEEQAHPALRNSELFAFTRREPLGVVAAITPFNFPLILSVSKLAPALAAGNTVVHKPASSTPLSALKLAEIVATAGLPDGVLNTVTGPGSEVGSALATHPLVDKIAFTGSTTVGIGLIKAGADSLKHTTMELGGKSPHVVLADTDLDRAAASAFFGCMWNKGEVCVAGTRLLVEQSIYEELLDRLIAWAKRAVVGDPLDPATTVGPLAAASEFRKVTEYIRIGTEDDRAPLAAGGGTPKLNGKGYFVEPTIFSPATNAMRVSREEIFGPVLAVIPVRDLDEAIAVANDSPYGLSSGIETGDYRKALRFAREVKAGTVWINTWHHYDPSAPFGGYKASGYGREHGTASFEAYTQHKTVWMETAS
jgi:acyl-CoA reductase-like NAD-dependent aldehyde dehydrogenase